METKIQNKQMEWIQYKLSLQNDIAIRPIGKKGGLALLWNQNVDLEIINYSHHIHAKISNNGCNHPGSLQGFYGNPDTSKRLES